MVLESANCTDCRSEIWHNDNYCQECGSRTSFLAQRDTQWRKAPTGPSWNREAVESSWSQSTEPTPIRSFVQSTSAPQSVPMSEPIAKPPTPVAPPPPPVAPPPPPLPPAAPVVPEIVVEKPETKVAPPLEHSVMQMPKPALEPEVKVAPIPVEPPKSVEPVSAKVEDTVLKARWTALESPLLRPRMSDEADEKKQPEEIVHKIKITNILWLCVCFLAGILIYCLFDIVKMTILKPDTATVKQQVVVPEAKPMETKPVETKVIEPKPEELDTAVPVKAVSVQPVMSVTPAAPNSSAKPATVKPIVVKPAAVKPAVKPIAKIQPPTKQPKLAVPTKLPAVAKPRPIPSAVHPEVVQPKTSADPNNSTRTRTVWQSPTSSAAPNPPARAMAPSSKSPVTSKGTGGDLARYNRLLADYFSRAGNGSFGDESSEPPTYSEWLSRGKSEF